MDLIYITADPVLAQIAQNAGVGRVMVDLEIDGKVERQGHLNTVISRHSMEDVHAIRRILKSSQLLVRVNPISANSKVEIDRCIAAGADILMLPMFRSAQEVFAFVQLVAGRAKCCLLLETAAALARIDDILEVKGIDEIHIGLNDLHLDLKLAFMFEVLSGGLVEYLADKLRCAGMKFGFGGVGRLNRGTLTSNLILSEHQRLGSTQVILSRDFNQVFSNGVTKESELQFEAEVAKTVGFCRNLSGYSVGSLNENSAELRAQVRRIVESLQSKARQGA